MELIPAFDPTTAPSGQFVAQTLQTGSKMIVVNKSYVDLIFTFANGDQRIVIANDRRAFTFGGATASPGPNVKWAQENIDYPQTINQLQNLVYIEIYSSTELVSETYPSPVQRETLPSLVPYNVGAGVQSTGAISPNNTNHTLWPSSYYGVTVAPQARGSVDGMGFDHFWEVGEGASFTMLDLPGHYPTTGKTANDATAANAALMSTIPGPFSKPGLTPVDSATHMNGDYFNLSTTIPWASATTGYYVDMWVNPDVSAINSSQFLICDDLAHFANTGFALYMSSRGNLSIEAAFVGGAIVFTTFYVVPMGIWTHIATSWSASTNTLTVYANGVPIQSFTTSGLPVNATHIPRIGSSPQDGGTFNGSIANVGILLSNPFGTQWGNNIALARYLLGQQSLKQDIQSLWLTGFDIVTLAAPAATYQYSLSNLFLPSGLLYHNVASTFDPLHIIQPGNIFMDFAVPQQTAPFADHVRFPNPITSDVINFMNFNDWVSTGPQYEANFYGFNLLGFS